jgi:hypothetical protein
MPPDQWTIVAIAATVAYATCWRLRPAWRSKNYSIGAHILFIQATGLLLLGPVGETLGHLTEPLICNLEDTGGHLCLLWAATAAVINAGRILRAPAITRAAVGIATAASPTIVAIAYWSGTYSHASLPSSPHDAAYGAAVPLLLLPAYVFASWTNLRVFHAAAAAARRIAGIQSASQAAAAVGCLYRLHPHPSLPNPWMYWCFAACLMGSTIAQWTVWQPFHRHMQDIRALRVLGESRGKTEDNPI